MQQVIEQILHSSDCYFNSTDKKNRKDKGQFFTPYNVANFMAGLLENRKETASILDPGAGTGLLTLSVVQELVENGLIKNATVDLFENDMHLIPLLENNMQLLRNYCAKQDVILSYNIICENFITYNKKNWEEANSKYDIVLGNPPYGKLRNTSEEAKIMKSIVFGQCNIYFLFLAMAISLLKTSGELVFILPRSFLSGKYFKKFRLWMLEQVTISHIHHFESRYNVFQGEIIQEIIIIKVIKNLKGYDGTLIKITSSSSNSDLDKLQIIEVSPEIIIEKSEVMCIKVPLSNDDILLIKNFEKWKYRLKDFGMSFCTGPVVDFRTDSFLRHKLTENTVPLIWSCNFNGKVISWPKCNDKFPQYIEVNGKIKNRLLPNQNYVLVKRLLAREGKKRVKANYCAKQGDYQFIGIENHINYLKYPININENILKGIFVLLNSSHYERYFRIINGTTQLNAGELNNIPIPSLEELNNIGANLFIQEDIESFDLVFD